MGKTIFLAYVVRDNDEGGTVVVFAKSAVAARRIGARELDIDFESVESCRRAPEFDGYASAGTVPNNVLLDHGWWFECSGCYRHISSDLDALYEYRDRIRSITLNPVFIGEIVYCCPSCKTRYEKEQRIRKEAEAKAIDNFRRRVLKRFPDAVFVENSEHTRFNQHASASRRGGGIEQIVVSFAFPGMQIAPATYCYDLNSSIKIGPSCPEVFCCSGDQEAFQAWAKGGAE